MSGKANQEKVISMKILIIDYCVDVVGGVERTLCTLSNNLVCDNDVIVLSENYFSQNSFYSYNDAVKKDYLFFFAGRDNTRLSIIKKVFRRIFLKSRIKKYLRLHKDVDVIIFGRVFVSLHFLPCIKRLLKNKPKIIVRDAIHLYDFKNTERKKLKKYFPGIVDTFIVSSNESAVSYKNFFHDDSIDIVKIYNPIGIDPVVRYLPEAKKVVSIGRMDDDQKGFRNLIMAFSEVHRSYPDWTLELYGDGKIKSDLCDLVDSLGACNYIFFPGVTRDVVGTLNNSSLFVLASRYEGYANSLVEAMACGVPSISYDWLMGVDEIIKDKDNGVVVRLFDRVKYMMGESFQADYTSLANAIKDLIEKKDLMEKFHDSAPKIVRTRSQEIIMKRWREIITKE